MRKADLEKEIERLNDKVACLTIRQNYAITELCELAQGIGVKPSWYGPSSSWEVCLKNKAALAVDKISKMRLP